MEEKIIEDSIKVEKSLAEMWDESQPIPLFDGNKMVFMYGSRGLSKMVTFVLKTDLNNQMIDEWMHTPEVPMEDEGRDKFYLRSKFKKALYKYREFIYRFPVKSMKKAKMEEKKIRKEQREIEVFRQLINQNK